MRMMNAPPRTRLPALGPHGEGWVALQSVLLVLLLVSGRLGTGLDSPARTVLAVVGAVVLAMVLGIALQGFARQGRQFTTMPRPWSDARLLDEGAYRLVRHPMYGGIVISAFGWALLTGSAITLLIAVITLAFFTLKSYREEAWLEERFPDYPAYRARTKRLIPWIY
jgi:protein-S-isoprenylcysteine O-methyltransferase Ste14